MAEDRFEQTIERYMVPISQRPERVTDATYFLRKDGSFVFPEGYCFPSDGIYGKIIYYPDPKGPFEIHGRRFSATNKEVVEGKTVLTAHDRQLEKHFEIDPSLDPSTERPVWAEYRLFFPFRDMAGFFDHHRSLRLAMETYPKVREAVEHVSVLLDVPIETLGVTGSLSYGKIEEPLDDIDIAFYGTVEENGRTIEKIRELVAREPERGVTEYGRFWPMRFYEGSLMFCPFFQYARWEDAPLRNFRMEVLRETVRATGVVSDDSHSIYMPPLLTLSEEELDGESVENLPLILYDGSLRGEFYRGDRVETGGRLVRVTQEQESFRAILITISRDIQKRG